MKKNRLEKVMGTKDVLMVAFGAMIGWGWVISSGDWIQQAGALGAVIGFLLGGTMIYFVGLVYAELTTAMPTCGAGYAFVYEAFGKNLAFFSTWAMILSYIGVVCFEACSLPTIFQYIIPGFLKGYLYTVEGFDIYLSWLLTAIFFGIVITYVNIRGTKIAAVFQTVLTLVIGGVGILLVAFSALHGQASNFEGQFLNGASIFQKTQNVFSIAVVAPFFLFGFDVIPQAAEEINVPLKKLGKLLLLSIMLAVSFYTFVVLAVGYALSPAEIMQSKSDSGLVTADAMAKVFGSEAMAKILVIGGICGIITSWNSFLLGGSRAILALSDEKMLPAAFTKMHRKYNTPVNALLLIGGLSVIAPFFGRVMLSWIANTASFACCIAYCVVSVAFLILRKQKPEMSRPFRIRHYKFVGICAISMSGLMVAMYAVPGSGCTLRLQEWIIAAGWTILGVIMLLCSGKQKKGRM